MKNNFVSRGLFILAGLIMLANTAFSVVNSLSPDINDLPEGEFLFSCVSPQNTSRVDFYLIKNSIGSAIRGERVGKTSKDNIFWQTNVDTVNAVWVDEYGIIINDIPINTKTDKYDSRRGTAIFSEGVLAENLTEND